MLAHVVILDISISHYYMSHIYCDIYIYFVTSSKYLVFLPCWQNNILSPTIIDLVLVTKQQKYNHYKSTRTYSIDMLHTTKKTRCMLTQYFIMFLVLAGNFTVYIKLKIITHNLHTN